MKHQHSMLKNYKELNVWQKSYELCSYGSVCELETQILLAGDLGFIEKGELDTSKKQSRNRKNVKSADKIFRKQTLESLTP